MALYYLRLKIGSKVHKRIDSCLELEKIEGYKFQDFEKKFGTIDLWSLLSAIEKVVSKFVISISENRTVK